MTHFSVTYTKSPLTTVSGLFACLTGHGKPFAETAQGLAKLQEFASHLVSDTSSELFEPDCFAI